MADISFDCPHCATHLVVEEGGAGLEAPCPACAADIVIPDPAMGGTDAERIESAVHPEASPEETADIPEAEPEAEPTGVQMAVLVEEPAGIPQEPPAQAPSLSAPHPPRGPVESPIQNVVVFDHWIDPEAAIGASVRPGRAWRGGRVIAVRAAAVLLLVGLSAYVLYRLSTGGFDTAERRNRELMRQAPPSPPLDRFLHRRLARSAARMMASRAPAEPPGGRPAGRSPCPRGPSSPPGNTPNPNGSPGCLSGAPSPTPRRFIRPSPAWQASHREFA